MKIVDEITEDRFIAFFLMYELDTPRFSTALLAHAESLGIEHSVLVSPDTDDAEQNATRRRLLSAHHGYAESRDLFKDFPSAVRWVRVVLNPEEVLRIRYMRSNPEVQLARVSRLPRVAAERIEEGERVIGLSKEDFVAKAEAIQEGDIFSSLILVASSEEAPLVILRGDLRLTAEAVVPEAIPDSTHALIGLSPEFMVWPEY